MKFICKSYYDDDNHPDRASCSLFDENGKEFYGSDLYELSGELKDGGYEIEAWELQSIPPHLGPPTGSNKHPKGWHNNFWTGIEKEIYL